jgi:hypothetical protein
MGSHRSPEDMLASVEAGAVAERARALADDMNHWLKDAGPTPMDPVDADVLEWCRSARDVLEAVARG